MKSFCSESFPKENIFNWPEVVSPEIIPQNVKNAVLATLPWKFQQKLKELFKNQKCWVENGFWKKIWKVFRGHAECSGGNLAKNFLRKCKNFRSNFWNSWRVNFLKNLRLLWMLFWTGERQFWQNSFLERLISVRSVSDKGRNYIKKNFIYN